MSEYELVILGIGVFAFICGLILAWLQRRCSHHYFLVRTIYGDEINHRNGKRRELSCPKCGKIKYE